MTSQPTYVHSHGLILKDGHTMFPEDTVKDIQYLQSERLRLIALNELRISQYKHLEAKRVEATS